MLTSRFPVGRPLALCAWLGSIAAVGFLLSGFAGCQGPDTFLRKPGSGAGGGSSGVGGSSFGTGGHGTGGTFGTGGSGVGGRIGTGGSSANGGSFGAGGSFGTGGVRGSGGAIVDAGMGGAQFDGSVDSEAGVAQRGACDAFCAPTTPVIDIVVNQGHGFNSAATPGTGELCFASSPDSVISGIVCSNFMAMGGNRMLSINGVLNATCAWPSPAPAKVNGGYCFQITPGVPNYAALAVF